MGTAELPVPGLLWGEYPERHRSAAEPQGHALPAGLRALAGRTASLLTRRHRGALDAFRTQRGSLRELSESRFFDAVCAVRLALQTEGLRDIHVANAFALASVACERKLGVRIFDTQVIAAGIVLGNRLAEMATGEGKTYALALAAAAAALAGVPVHVITANDYLVTRDADLMRPVYGVLGLTTGAAVQGQGEAERRSAYACDITYCTAKELVFDYLRDGRVRNRDPLGQRVDSLTGAARAPLLLRGLCMALIDEADSILIDEARVPFILARAAGNAQETGYLVRSLDVARQLRPGIDFTCDGASPAAALTRAGRERIEESVRHLAPVWRNRPHREETIATALAALHGYARDRHYLVRDGKVLIIDDTTGRVAPGRAWSRGLHQLIEIKEGLTPSAPQVTAAQITYQRFFPRYLRLGGLSGTLSESAGELLAHYDLAVRRVPLRVPDRRRMLPSRLFPDRKALWEAVACRVLELTGGGRPVLVGTDSVADSEALSRHLNGCEIAHGVLNARNDRAEAEIVARAGQRAAVTVATNMAGRGTDIPLGVGVAALGGLHVICCQLNAARRIDRQLAGRCARQGDPGSCERWFPADASLFRAALPRLLQRVLAGVADSLPSPLVRALAASLQWSVERRHVRGRRRLLEHDRTMDRWMSFGGPPD